MAYGRIRTDGGNFRGFIMRNVVLFVFWIMSDLEIFELEQSIQKELIEINVILERM
jgi:hypothetical protein